MDITGENGRTAKVLTGWINDINHDDIASIFVETEKPLYKVS
jgi:hypothetical protein